MNSFEIKTLQNKISVKFFFGFLPKEEITVNRKLFEGMCRNGCKNYNKKYSCPPFVPDLNVLLKNCDGLFVILFMSNLGEINSTEYNKVRISNSVMKSRLLGLMRHLEKKFDTTFLGTGSCNLCKPCKLKLNLPCKHPEERRYSLEAAGVDCNELSRKLFNVPLLWYENKKAPDYGCVTCGLLCRKEDVAEIEKEIRNYKFV